MWGFHHCRKLPAGSMTFYSEVRVSSRVPKRCTANH
jgi:hypothetical protein